MNTYKYFMDSLHYIMPECKDSKYRPTGLTLKIEVVHLENGYIVRYAGADKYVAKRKDEVRKLVDKLLKETVK